MSGERIRRASRLVEIRAREVTLAEVALGERIRASTAADAAVHVVLLAREAATSAAPARLCSSADLAEMYAYRLGLMRKADSLAALAKKVKLEELEARGKLRAVNTELKKVETWRDRLVEGLRAEELGHERKAADEVAARIARNA
ncbi:MAG TPA: hypothetical protein VII82_13940 [Polyangiaceae bacterium]|jgi:flagellar biosynthesis chaperone FliJ